MIETNDYLRYSLHSSYATLPNEFAVFIATINAANQLLLTHHRNIDAISCGHCSKRNVSLCRRTIEFNMYFQL